MAVASCASFMLVMALPARLRVRDNGAVYAVTTTAAHHGVESFLVRVEARLTPGSLPQFLIVGLPDAAVREGAERVRAAIRTTIDAFPDGRCVLNLSPAWRRKAGSAFDLAIAMALLAAAGQCQAEAIRDVVFIGELGLDGALRLVSGSLPAAIAAGRKRRARMVLPGSVQIRAHRKLRRCVPAPNTTHIVASLLGRHLPTAYYQAAIAANFAAAGGFESRGATPNAL